MPKNPFKKKEGDFKVKSSGLDSHAKDKFSQEPAVQNALAEIRKGQAAKATDGGAEEPTHMSREELFGGVKNSGEKRMTLDEFYSMQGGKQPLMPPVKGESLYAQLDFSNQSTSAKVKGAGDGTIYSGVRGNEKPKEVIYADVTVGASGVSNAVKGGGDSTIYSEIKTSSNKEEYKAALKASTGAQGAPVIRRDLKPQPQPSQSTARKMGM